MMRCLPFAVLLLVVWAPAVAQEVVRDEPSEHAVSAIDWSGDPVVVRGSLTSRDERSEGGEPFDRVATVTWEPGTTIRVSMESASFDTYLILAVLGEGETYENDDFEGSTRQSFVEETNESGRDLRVEIHASAYSEGELGSYTVRYELVDGGGAESPSVPTRPSDPAPPTPAPSATTVDGELPHTARIEGRLTSRTRVHNPGADDELRGDTYTLTLGEEEAVSVRLESSSFRAAFSVESTDGGSRMIDDLLGHKGYARTTLFGPGRFTLRVGTDRIDGRGDYTLVVYPTEKHVFQTERFVLDDRTFEGELDAFDDYEIVTQNGAQREADTFDVELEAGVSLTVSVSSQDFDTFLVIKRGEEIIALNDDDNGDTSRSQISNLTIEESGTYTIVVASFDDGGRGEYFLDGYTRRSR